MNLSSCYYSLNCFSKKIYEKEMNESSFFEIGVNATLNINDSVFSYIFGSNNFKIVIFKNL